MRDAAPRRRRRGHPRHADVDRYFVLYLQAAYPRIVTPERSELERSSKAGAIPWRSDQAPGPVLDLLSRTTAGWPTPRSASWSEEHEGDCEFVTASASMTATRPLLVHVLPRTAADSGGLDGGFSVSLVNGAHSLWDSPRSGPQSIRSFTPWRVARTRTTHPAQPRPLGHCAPGFRQGRRSLGLVSFTANVPRGDAPTPALPDPRPRRRRDVPS